MLTTTNEWIFTEKLLPISFAWGFVQNIRRSWVNKAAWAAVNYKKQSLVGIHRAWSGSVNEKIQLFPPFVIFIGEWWKTGTV